MIKSQVVIGGRGKAGGIKFADSPAEGAVLARELVGKVLRNEQNSRGEIVRSLLVEEKLAIASEAYVSIAIDRTAKKTVIIVTARGGMDVEEVAAHEPEAISKYWLDPAIGLQPFVARQLAFAANLPPGYRKAFPKVFPSRSQCVAKRRAGDEDRAAAVAICLDSVETMHVGAAGCGVRALGLV